MSARWLLGLSAWSIPFFRDKRDVLVGLATPGNRESVLETFKTAKRLGMTIIALFGNGDGAAKALAGYVLVVPSDDAERIYGHHILIGHFLSNLIEAK